MRIFLCLCLVLSLAGCQAKKASRQAAAELPRPGAGYLHWMQKQSMLGQAPELISQVSQSQRVWLQSSEPGRASVLLAAAPNWLELVGVPENSRSPVFRALAAQTANARRMGFCGIYLGETGEKPDIWTARDGKPVSRRSASLNFDASFGTDADFEKLAKTAETDGLELGSDLLAGATGLGPDFFLQARNSAEHGGLYALLPVPEKAIPHLPLTREEWDNEALPAQTVASLADEGVLPKALARDKLAWASPGGWAATGPVMGKDGAVRRWVYRFSENPSQPLLSWQDPSGHAARVLQASAIRLTGIQGQSLAGIHFEPLMALEPGDASRPSLSPGMAALNEIARQIHRYGGWAMQADPLPLNAIAAVLAGPCDFCRDDITPLLVAYGLITADAGPVGRLYQGWIANRLDISRLARGYNASAGLAPRILLDNPAWSNVAARLAEFGANLTFASLANHIYPNPAEAQAEALRRILLSWRLGLPGLGFVEFYPSSLIEPSDGWLEHILAARRDSGLAQGTVISVTRGPGGAIGILSRLPAGGYWLLACNFGKRRDTLSLSLPAAASDARDAGTGEALNRNLNGQKFWLGLDGQQARNVLFTKSGIKPKKPESAHE